MAVLVGLGAGLFHELCRFPGSLAPHVGGFLLGHPQQLVLTP